VAIVPFIVVADDPMALRLRRGFDDAGQIVLRPADFLGDSRFDFPA
jgi:hypothetical protein